MLASRVAVCISMVPLVPDILLSGQNSKVAKARDELMPYSEVPTDQVRPSKPAELSQITRPVSEGRCNEATAMEWQNVTIEITPRGT